MYQQQDPAKMPAPWKALWELYDASSIGQLSVAVFPCRKLPMHYLLSHARGVANRLK
jgi:hypothetical protein